MTYLAYWFHVFSALDKIETAGRRIEKFVEITASSLEKQNSFEVRMKSLLAAIAGKQAFWSSVR